MKTTIALFLVPSLLLLGATKKDGAKNGQPAYSALDQYIHDALSSSGHMKPESPGSLWSSQSGLTDLASDVRSRYVNDLVVISVGENVSAVTSGDLKSQRQSALSASISSLAGPKAPKGALANLANTSTNSSITGAGSTSRQTTITTTLAARVTYVLPNGYLVLEGTKEIQLNSEKQIVTVRGVARPADLANNTISSSNLAQLEVKVNGKGVVGDAIRRPFILYRLLMGILPL